MMRLLEFRARLKYLYQRLQPIVDPIVKCLFAFICIRVINNNIGYDTRFTGLPIVIVLSVLCAFLPSVLVVFFVAVLSVVHIYSMSMLLAIMIVMIYVILFCFFARFSPKYGYVLLAVPVLYLLGVPYLMPLLLGALCTPLAILPTACGTVVFYIFGIVKDEVFNEVAFELDDVLALYIRVVDKIVTNREMFLDIVCFAAVICVIYLIRRTKADYSSEIALGAGAVVMLLGLVVGRYYFGIDSNIGALIVGVLISIVLVLIAMFFRRVLDYTAVERVQFEDDDYYYYVKAVPKINISLPSKRVQRFNEKRYYDEEEVYEEAYEDIEASEEIEEDRDDIKHVAEGAVKKSKRKKEKKAKKDRKAEAYELSEESELPHASEEAATTEKDAEEGDLAVYMHPDGYEHFDDSQSMDVQEILRQAELTAEDTEEPKTQE